ncbi:Protein PTR-19 c [Aphelenchoides avenae]|nr:Protein PTR-19 c [Aphelenchus avenae]
MRFECVERRLSRLFANYAHYVVAAPAPFIIIPVVLTAFLSTGLLRHSEAFVKDELDLYTPRDARAREELKQLDVLFHINDTDPFYASRRYDIKRAGYIIVTSDKEGGDILNPMAMQAAMHLWGVIQSLTIEPADNRTSYPSMCVKFPMPAEFNEAIATFLATNLTSSDKICVSNPIVEVFKVLLLSDRSVFNKSLDEITLGQITETFSLDSLNMRHLLGGIQLDSAKRIAGAKAIMLPYALRHSNKAEDELAEKWELKLAEFLHDFDSPLIKTSWWTYETLASESARDRQQLIRMLVPCFIVISLYTILMCCTTSWVRSRPLLAIGGVLSAAMAIASAVGLVLLCGYSLTSVAFSMPFIVFSVGVDNVFILLAAWRATSVKLTLSERMSETFGDAAVSITVTSLTDLISFSVGCLTPFPSVQMFCVYAACAVLFTYVYQLTFFAAVMTVTSRREMANRHCLTFQKVHAVRKTMKKCPDDVYATKASNSSIYWDAIDFKNKQLHGDGEPPQGSLSSENNSLANFFRTTYTDLILNPMFRMVVVALATYGSLNIQLGMEPTDLLPDNSYGKRTLRLAETYFSDYGSSLHVWFYNLSKLDLGHRRLWVVLEKEIELYEHTEFTGDSDSWLRSFFEYTHKMGLLVTENNFSHLIWNIFLAQPQFAKYRRDVLLNEEGSKLEACRVTVHLRYVGSSNQSRAMHLFRHLAETSELPTGVYADFFQFAEQYNAVLPGTLSSIGMAGGAVVIVSLLLIPEPVAAFWVSFSILSINVGILGFMTFWSVRLDFISMVTIVMSIGFCADFAAHLAYNFARGENLSRSERLRKALHTVGVPILQSASSTIIGVSFMASTESYVFRSFLKTIILVISLGVFHGLVILPVLLTSSSPCSKEDDESYGRVSARTIQEDHNATDAPAAVQRNNALDKLPKRLSQYRLHE